jgi:hypothetical protein
MILVQWTHDSAIMNQPHSFMDHADAFMPLKTAGITGIDGIIVLLVAAEGQHRVNPVRKRANLVHDLEKGRATGYF